MRLLVTNDDGVGAPGLWALVRALRDLAEVVVVAPDREQSGVGAGFTLHQPIRVRRVFRRGVPIHAVEGTPADAVILALNRFYPDGIDAIIAGINPGSNMGRDVFLSGTVGAALQGHFRGVPSIAISMARIKRPRYSTGAQIARALIPSVAGNELFKSVLLNVTVPNLSVEQIQGVEVTRLMERSSTLEVRAGDDGRRGHYWIGVRFKKPTKKERAEIPEGTDVWAIREKRVSITPLHTDLTAHGTSDALSPLRDTVRAALTALQGSTPS
ncbi:MAG: 5'/3'-nucleotidase SurE [Chloroflexi bacterium]|nr:5'/3'-nucleotidase SurE [Chloroflexota bacterium]